MSLTAFNLVTALLLPDQLTGAGVRVLALPNGGYWADPTSLGRIAASASIWAGVNWILAATLIAIVVFWEKSPLRSIGFKRLSAVDLFWASVALVAFYAIGILGNNLGSLPDPRLVAAIFALPAWARISVLTELVCEEIMFRGFLIEHIEGLTGSTGLAAFVSCALFGLAHASGWGLGYVLVVASVAIPYALLYVYRRNLYACMIVHLLTDIQIVWLSLSPFVWVPRLLRLI